MFFSCARSYWDKPTANDCLAFFDMHGSEFEIDTSLSSAQKQLVKDRVVARIMRMLNSAYSFVSSGFSQVDGLEDDPISSTTNESLDNLFERKYGERPSCLN